MWRKLSSRAGKRSSCLWAGNGEVVSQEPDHENDDI